MGWYNSYYPPYVSVAQRRAKAVKAAEKLKKQGKSLSPVVTTGLKLGKTFWGKAWCDHIERFGDFASRLPKGKTYVRNGSVFDLQIASGRIDAMVSGSEVYDVTVKIKPLPADKWAAIKARSAGQVGSLVELLQGKLSNAVMGVVTEPKTGLFPLGGEISLSCSCPDYADMCKHVAAVMYGVGVRLDDSPALLFKLRGVDESELIAAAATAGPAVGGAGDRNTLAAGDLADVFGLDLEATPAAAAVPPAETVRVVATRRTKATVAAPKKAARAKPPAKKARGKAAG